MIADIEPLEESKKANNLTAVEIKMDKDKAYYLTRTMSHSKFLSTYRTLVNDQIPDNCALHVAKSSSHALTQSDDQFKLHNVALRGIADADSGPSTQHKLMGIGIADRTCSFHIAFTQQEADVNPALANDLKTLLDAEKNPWDKLDIQKAGGVTQAEVCVGLVSELEESLKDCLEESMNGNWLMMNRMCDDIIHATNGSSMAQQLNQLRPIREKVLEFGEGIEQVPLSLAVSDPCEFSVSGLSANQHNDSEAYQAVVLKLVQAYVGLAQPFPDEEIERTVNYPDWQNKLTELTLPFSKAVQVLQTFLKHALLSSQGGAQSDVAEEANDMMTRAMSVEVNVAEEIGYVMDNAELIDQALPTFVAQSNVTRLLAQQYVDAGMKEKILQYRFRVAAARTYHANELYDKVKHGYPPPVEYAKQLGKCRACDAHCTFHNN